AAKTASAARQSGEARSRYRRPPKGGDGEAEMILGRMAERGLGGPQDLEEALGWYAAAARRGVPGASQKVALVTAALRRQATFARSEHVPSPPAESNAAAEAASATASTSSGASSPPAPERKPAPPAPARGQKAEPLTPQPAPTVTAEAEPLPEVGAAPSATPAPEPAPSPKATQPEATPPDAQPDKPIAAVPQWPVPAVDDRGQQNAAPSTVPEQQEASLPPDLLPPFESGALAPMPKRAPPKVSEDAQRKLAQAKALEAAKGDAKAIEIYRSIAEEVPEAAFDLGWRYASGRGVKRDDKEAAHYYRMAADKGFAAAQNNLGGLYAEGRGVARNDEEAVDWYRRAALQDFAPAQANLAFMYGKGRGVPQSDANAMAWYSRAAKAGYGPATASLAMMYSEGKGVPQDQGTADFLMKSADGASPASALVSVGP
ncbi:MAG: hypothetical protein ACM30I_13910, partial [Gemmatimonas sp.]